MYIVDLLVGKDGLRGKNFNMCWVVVMVGDIYCLLCCGGIFMYFFDNCDLFKSGKLCLLYEVNLMVFFME